MTINKLGTGQLEMAALASGHFTMNYGEEFPESFLDAWAPSFETMPYCILETASGGTSIHASSNLEQVPSDVLRLNLFGETGDVFLRRDETRVFWRYVGKPRSSLTLECTQFDGNLWFDKDDDQSALFWGLYSEGTWHEDRVGRANLNYPISSVDSKHGRVQVQAHVVRAQNAEIFAYWTYNINGV